MENWLELAKKKFSNSSITGTGRWALTALDSPGEVWLFESYDNARAQVLDVNRVRISDLQATTPVPTKCRDIGYE